MSNVVSTEIKTNKAVELRELLFIDDMALLEEITEKSLKQVIAWQKY